MKFKKILAILATTIISFSCLAGCSESTNNYVKEISNISSWEASETQLSGNIVTYINGEAHNTKVLISETTSDTKAHVKMDLIDKSIDLPAMDMYVDGNKEYINKDFLVACYNQSKIPVSDSLKNSTADYLEIDTNVDTDNLMNLSKSPESLMNFYSSLVGNKDIDIPIVQNGRSYSLTLDSDTSIDLYSNFIQSLSNNSILQLSGAIDNELNALSSIPENDLNTVMNGLKETLKGSTISTKEIFSDDMYATNISAKVKLNGAEAVDINISGVSNKKEKFDIAVPQNTIKADDVI